MLARMSSLVVVGSMARRTQRLEVMEVVPL